MRNRYSHSCSKVKLLLKWCACLVGFACLSFNHPQKTLCRHYAQREYSHIIVLYCMYVCVLLYCIVLYRVYVELRSTLRDYDDYDPLSFIALYSINSLPWSLCRYKRVTLLSYNLKGISKQLN